MKNKYVDELLKQCGPTIYYNTGFRCNNCQAGPLRRELAIKHDCKKYKTSHSGRYESLLNPNGGFYKQAKIFNRNK